MDVGRRSCEGVMHPQAEEDTRWLVNPQKLGDKCGTDPPSHPSGGTNPTNTQKCETFFLQHP